VESAVNIPGASSGALQYEKTEIERSKLRGIQPESQNLMKSNRSFSFDIEEARRRLEVWRKSRRRGKRIPAPLWALAAALARAH
jgi:predicted nucleic acid-binding protein